MSISPEERKKNEGKRAVDRNVQTKLKAVEEKAIGLTLMDHWALLDLKWAYGLRVMDQWALLDLK